MAASDAPKFDIVATLPQGASENQVPQMLQALLADRFKLASHRENKERTVYGLVVARGGLKAKKSSADADTPAAVAAAGPDAASAPPSAVVNVGGAQTRVMDLPSRGGGTTAMTSPGMGTVLSTMGPNGVERLEASDITFEALAGLLSTLTVAPVPIVDMTGMKGRYQVVLELSWKELGAARTAGVALDPASDPAILAAQLDDFRQSLQKYGLRLESRKRPVETMVVDRLEKTPAAN
jgi:uncharacterized protein (TIGR03435 family)